MNQKLEEYVLKLNIEQPKETLVMPGLPLFHYTSLNAFQNIVQDNKLVLWATDIHYLNDKKEWKHAQEVYQFVCGELLNEGKISQTVYERITSIQPNTEITFIRSFHDSKNNIDIINGAVKNTAKFVICFSMQSDSLPMWNYYSNGANYCGCCFGTISDLLLNNAICFPKLIRSKLYEVVYKFDKKKRIIEDTILELVKRTESLDELQEVQNQLSYKLSEWCFCFKDPHFEYEEEVRLCVDLPQEDYAHTVKYRVNHGMLIPYIELEFQKETLLNVMIGPLACAKTDKELQKNATRNMLLSRGYSCDYISFSRCPIRF